MASDVFVWTNIYTIQQFNKHFIQIIQFSQKNISILVSEIWFRSVFSPRATVCLVFVPKWIQQYTEMVNIFISFIFLFICCSSLDVTFPSSQNTWSVHGKFCKWIFSTNCITASTLSRLLDIREGWSLIFIFYSYINRPALEKMVYFLSKKKFKLSEN